MPLQRVDVDLQFKGGRDYLHGTDVYDAAVALLKGAWPELDGRCRFTFFQMARQPLTAVLGEFAAGATRPQGCVAEMHVTGARTGASVWFVRREGVVAGRYAYDEDGVVRDCAIAGDTIRSGTLPPVRPIEMIVAMTKRLHGAVQPLEGARWLFTRLDLHSLLPDDLFGVVSVSLAGGGRASITRSEITLDGRQAGSIYFSRGRL